MTTFIQEWKKKFDEKFRWHAPDFTLSSINKRPYELSDEIKSFIFNSFYPAVLKEVKERVEKKWGDENKEEALVIISPTDSGTERRPALPEIQSEIDVMMKENI